MTKISLRRLEAIAEALTRALAEGVDGERRDYEAAQSWVDEQIEKRRQRRGASDEHNR